MVIMAADGELNTAIYWKSTNTIRMLHFNSNDPIGHKVVLILIERLLIVVQMVPNRPKRHT